VAKWFLHKSAAAPPLARMRRGRMDWITSVDRSLRAGSVESLWPAGRPSRAPGSSHSPHTRRRRLHIRDSQGEMKSLHGSPRKAVHGRIGHWFRRPPKREMRDQAMTLEVRGVVSLSLSRQGNALARQIAQRVRQVNATLAEQNRRALGMIPRGSRA